MAPVINPYGIGARQVSSWTNGEHPESWAEAVLRSDRAGMVPLTAITQVARSSSVDSPIYHWWDKSSPEQGGALGGLYTDAALTTAYAAGDNYAAGATVFAKVAAAVVKEFRVGFTVKLEDPDYWYNDIVGIITSIDVNGDSSRIAIRLLQDDNDSLTENGSTVTRAIENCEYIYLVGDAQVEGSWTPDSITYDVNKYTNVTQIFRTPLNLTRTAEKTRYRTGDALKNAKQEALELHQMAIEKAYWDGVYSEGTLSGKDLRTTMGVVNFVQTYAPSNVLNYKTDADYSGKSWSLGGMDFMDEALEQAFRYGNNKKVAYAGNGAILAINKLAKEWGTFNMTSKTAVFGSSVTEWVTPFGTIYLKNHPLWTNRPAFRHRLVILDPKNVKERYITPTTYKKDKSDGGPNTYDGRVEEFLTEAGLELIHPEEFTILYGIGENNAV